MEIYASLLGHVTLHSLSSRGLLMWHHLMWHFSGTTPFLTSFQLSYNCRGMALKSSYNDLKMTAPVWMGLVSTCLVEMSTELYDQPNCCNSLGGFESITPNRHKFQTARIRDRAAQNDELPRCLPYSILLTLFINQQMKCHSLSVMLLFVLG